MYVKTVFRKGRSVCKNINQDFECFAVCHYAVDFGPSALVSYAAEVSLNITDENGNDITEIQQLTEYKTLQLKYTTTGELPEGTTVKWESNLPLLADVDDNGKVTAYDSSKTAIIQLWLDENVRVLPLVGDKMADEIMKQLEKSGVNLDSMNDDLIVSIVRGIAGDTLADSLASALANMNVEITATVYDASGAKLASDKIKIKVQKSVVANIFPTGTHITNKERSSYRCRGQNGSALRGGNTGKT